MAWHSCAWDDCGHSLSEAIPLHHGVEDISAVEAAPARYPHTFCTLHEIEEVIFRHTTLTTCTGHDALLVCLSSHHKSKGSPLSRLDPKEVPQMKGDVTQPAFIHDGSPSRRSRSAILWECSPVAPHVRTIEVRACQNNFSRSLLHGW